MNNSGFDEKIKGSKYWMREMTSRGIYIEKLNSMLGTKLEWISPTKDGSYREFELRGCADIIGLEEGGGKADFSFWPQRQPQWDGIALGHNDKKRVLYLFEAKAHTQELHSYCRTKSEENKRIITELLSCFQGKCYPNASFKCWMNGYYQLANRLLFLNKVKAMKSAKYSDVKLVLIYFINDTTYISTSEEEWLKSSQKALRNLTGFGVVPKDVIELFVDVQDISKSRVVIPD
ncbi:MAG: hypothetical protein J5537_07785 [Lachnospiraceae bacterium]|nr:hypothetical protein [Lachnospiraceae bacterium]